MESLFVEYLKEKLPFLACVAVLILLFICAGVISHVRNKIKELAVQRKCIFQIVATFAAVLTVLLLLFFSDKTDVAIVASVSGALILICFFIWWFTFHLPPFAYLYISKYKKLYRSGYVYEKIEEVRKKPFFIFTVTGRLKFAILQCGYFFWAADNKAAYRAMFEVSKLNLTEKERSEVSSRIMFALYCLGAFSAARDKYSDILKPSATDDSVLSILYEEEGKSDKAENVINSLNNKMLSNELSLDEKGVISNNFGRSYKLKNNNIGAVKQYREAINYSCARKDIYNLLLSYSNLVMTLSTYDTEGAKQEYEKFLAIAKGEPFTMYKFQEYANLKLMLSEKLNDREAIQSIINEVIEKSETVIPRYKINLLMMTARIIANKRLDVMGVLFKLNDLQNDIFSAPMPDRYNWIKDLYFIFLQIMLPSDSPLLPLRDRVGNYMLKEALSDVDTYINDLPQYAVHETVGFIRERIYIKKLAADYSFYDVQRDFIQLADICDANSLGFAKLTAYLNIINEAYDPPNIQSVTNGIPKSKYDKEVKEILPSVRKTAESYTRHPGIADVYLQLCFYCICDGDFKAAKDYMKKFDELNISINRFGFYIIRQYNICKYILNNCTEVADK